MLLTRNFKSMLPLATRIRTRAFSSRFPKTIDSSQLPPEKPDFFRKRPVDIEYNRADFSAYYLPSEKQFYYSGNLNTDFSIRSCKSLWKTS